MSGLGMAELIARIGDDNVKFQNLFDGDVDVTATKRGTRITFYTEPTNLTPASALDGKNHKVCLVLWLERADVDRVLAEYRTRLSVLDAHATDESGASGARRRGSR